MTTAVMEKKGVKSMTDYISRQAAIGVLEERLQANGYSNVALVSELNRSIGYLMGLPPAQSELIRINLNESIKVKLTDWGKEIYYHQYDRINQIAGREICKQRFPKEDENGYTEFQLWRFIELYGMHMGITSPNVIEPLEIIYKR